MAPSGRRLLAGFRGRVLEFILIPVSVLFSEAAGILEIGSKSGLNLGNPKATYDLRQTPTCSVPWVIKYSREP